jgi:antitoxin HicB
MFYKIPLILTPQPEGGYTVTSPLLPELITEGDSLEEALENVKDALAAVIEIYRDLGRSFTQSLRIANLATSIFNT